MKNKNKTNLLSSTFLLSLISVLFLSVTSCKKCHVCAAKDQDGVARYSYPEMCGSKKELSAYADKCDSEYGKYDYSCECGESLN
jgi:hypothetical protein